MKWMEQTHLLRELRESCEMIVIGLGKEMASPYQAQLQKEGDDPQKEWEKAKTIYHEIWLNQGEELKKWRDAYRILGELIEGKNYFIITTNFDSLVYEQGFHSERIVAPCGDIRRMQCENPAHGIWTAEDALREGQKEVLCCPVCRNLGRLNIRTNLWYAEEGYQADWERYRRWFQTTIHKKVLMLELGEGLLTPTVFRWPFEKAVYYNKKSVLIRVHEIYHQIPEEIQDRAYTVPMHSIDFLMQEWTEKK